MARWISRPLRQRLVGATVLMRPDARVGSGPFRGMRLLWSASGSSFYPKLTGTYEYELHGVLTRVIDDIRPKRIVDIGAAEGYYAVGLARCLPQARVVAYEMNAAAAAMLRRLAQKNGVADRIDLRGRCEVAALADDLTGAGPTLVICDTEGFERVAMDPQAVPGLATAHVLVETHDHAAPGILEDLRARFAPTHAVQAIPCTLDRDAMAHRLGPFHRWLPADWRFRLLCERLRETPWLWMEPR